MSSFKKIAKSLTGISTPIFGISWNPPKSDRDLVRRLLLYLEDKRALYYPYDTETPDHVVDSVLQIRRRLSELIHGLEVDSELLPQLRALRASCRTFLDLVDESKSRRGLGYQDSLTALGELRGVFGIHVAQLSVKYGVAVDSELAKILPVGDTEENS